MAQPNAQWKINNQPELEKILTDFAVQFERSGDHLLITGPMGLEIELEPGDGVIIDGERIGVVRVPKQVKTEKLKAYASHCENCGKEVKVKIGVLQDPATVTIVCSDACRETLEFKLKMNDGVSPLN